MDGYHKIYDKIIKDADCLTLKDLALNGRDLIELGVKPGPQIGNILAKLLDVVIEDVYKRQISICASGEFTYSRFDQVSYPSAVICME